MLLTYKMKTYTKTFKIWIIIVGSIKTGINEIKIDFLKEIDRRKKFFHLRNIWMKKMKYEISVVNTLHLQIGMEQCATYIFPYFRGRL